MNRSLLALLLLPLAAHADPLDCIPKQANIVIKVETPRALVEGAVQLDAWQKLQAFPNVKEALDNVQVRRFLQLVTFIESTTGTKWPQLIDQVAGNGIALAFKAGDENAPALAVIEGTDAATVEQVFAIFVAGLKDEAGRNSAMKVTETTHEGATLIFIGDDFHVARSDARILISNKKAAIEAGLTLATKKPSKFESITRHPTLGQAKSLLGDGAAAWLWFDLAAAKETSEGKAFFENTRKELVQLLLLGSTMDAARRSDFLAVGLFAKPEGYKLSVRMPARRSELDPVMKLHVPAGGVGSKPLLEPPGVVASLSFHLDQGYLWKDRKNVIADDMVRKDFEKGESDISKVLPGTSFGKILEGLGPHHRFVMAHTGEKLYTREPGQPIAPTAYVVSLRDAELAKSLDGILRAAGLVAGFQTGWKMSEVEHEGVKIVTYTFPEKGDPKFEDVDNLRFNAAPSFALAHGSLIVGSTPGIVKAVLPLLKNERDGDAEVWRLKVYAAGAADLLAAHPDATVTETVLTQGITLAEARKQVIDVSKWLRTLGTASMTIDHTADYYRFDTEWMFKK